MENGLEIRIRASKLCENGVELEMEWEPKPEPGNQQLQWEWEEWEQLNRGTWRVERRVSRLWKNVEESVDFG